MSNLNTENIRMLMKKTYQKMNFWLLKEWMKTV